MCVTLGRAHMNHTRAYAYATTRGNKPYHVSGYQNTAQSLLDHPNVMFLNFAGTNLELVDGPQRTQSMMQDMTQRLMPLKAMNRSGGAKGMMGIPRVEAYGDYYVVISEGPGDIIAALADVPEEFRPLVSPALEQLVAFYMDFAPSHSFVLACWRGSAVPKHPIVVGYEPNDSSILTIPGLDGHDGRVPVPGLEMPRNFKLAFGVEGVEMPFRVYYDDNIEHAWWAPSTVNGFYDNREEGPNQDYRLRISDLRLTGDDLLIGHSLAKRLILAA